MSHRIVSSIGAVAILACVGVGAAIASTGPTNGAQNASERETHEVTLRFAAKELTPNVFVDVGTPGNSVGDYVIEHETLFRRDQQIGHDTLQCTAIHGPPTVDFQCVGTLVLAGGQITFQGATDFSSIVVAVTGGTGKYQGAYGELTVHGTQTTTDNDVAHLVLPD